MWRIEDDLYGTCGACGTTDEQSAGGETMWLMTTDVHPFRSALPGLDIDKVNNPNKTITNFHRDVELIGDTVGNCNISEAACH